MVGGRAVGAEVKEIKERLMRSRALLTEEEGVGEQGVGLGAEGRGRVSDHRAGFRSVSAPTRVTELARKQSRATVANPVQEATVANRMQNAKNVASDEQDATYVEDSCEAESPTVMTFTVKDMDARICRRIGIYRERAGLTQEELGAKLDPPVRRNEVNRWENGHKTPVRWRQHQIAEVLGIDPGLLYSENGDGQHER